MQKNLPTSIGRKGSSSSVHRTAGSRGAVRGRTIRDPHTGEVISGPGTFGDVRIACHRWLMKNDESYRRDFEFFKARRLANSPQPEPTPQ